jgi:hypothetical protein
MPEQSAQLHPEGWYNLEIIENGISQAGTGSYSVYLIFKPINPSYPNLVRDLYLTDNAIERTVQTLRELGFQGDKFEDFKNNPQLMAGIVARVQVNHEDYQKQDGTTVKIARIGWVNSPNRKFRQMAESVPNNISRLNAILKATPKTSVNMAQQPVPDQGNRPEVPDGDVPF